MSAIKWDFKRREQIFRDINDERLRQHEKFGDQSGLGRMFMLAVLSEEVGEACQAAVDAEINRQAWESPKPELDADVPPPEPAPWPASLREQFNDRLRAELVQVAAVAVQIIEHIDSEANRG